MNILDIIQQEHREAAAMLDRAKEMEPGDSELVKLTQDLEQALSTHLDIEERLFYGRLRDRAEEQDEKVDVFEGYTEHEVAKHLIALLRSRRKRDELFKAEIQVLGESVKHHVQEEESTIFSLARELMEEDELEDLGAKWTRAREKTPATGPAPRQARKPAGRKAASAKKGGKKGANGKKGAGAKKKGAKKRR